MRGVKVANSLCCENLHEWVERILQSRKSAILRLLASIVCSCSQVLRRVREVQAPEQEGDLQKSCLGSLGAILSPATFCAESSSI